MRPLIITPEITESLLELVAHAEANPVSKKDVEEMSTGKQAPVGDSPIFYRLVPFGYRVVLSYFTGTDKPYRYHVSVSVETPKKLPSVQSVSMILKTMGLQDQDWKKVWLEDFEKDRQAVNILCSKG